MYVIARLRMALAAFRLPRNRHCAICENRVGRFLPYRGGLGAAPGLMLSLDIVGSDVENFTCPRCGAHDRERHLLMYLQATGLLTWMRGKDVLHVAPEQRLPARIAASDPSRYVRCDLHPQTPDLLRVDMLAMPFNAGTFDMVIANHVLEHVDDDLKALAEIRRVLKIGGYAILQTPYSRKLHHTWQDRGIADDQSRLQAFGQEDHVRLYGRDIFERFASAGLESQVRQHADLLADVNVIQAGVNPAEPFFLFRKI